MLAIDSRLRLDVTDMGLDGDPIARLDSYVVLVPGAIPGERVEAVVFSSNRKLARARVTRIVQASPHRVVPRCQYFGPCGGCSWQHIAYAEQLRLKQRMIASLLERALDAPVTVLPTLGLEGSGDARDPAAPWGFRDKVHFVFGLGHGDRSLVMGHYRRQSRDVLATDECPVHAAKGNAAAFAVRDAFLAAGVRGADGEGKRGLARHVVVRVAGGTSDVHATVVTASRGAKEAAALLRELPRREAGVSAVHLNLHDGDDPFIFGRTTRTIHGPERLTESVAGTKFLISPRSFFQTCTRSAELLAQVVLRSLPVQQGGTVLDLYAGAGLFSLPLASRGQRVLAVEENPAAVADGIASLRLNGIGPDRCRYVRGRVEDALRDLTDGPRDERGGIGPVVLDPPREGCPEEVWRRLLRQLRPLRVVYVSCNPRALAQDLALARRFGYRVVEVQPVDMFPHTAHIESVAKLERA